MRNRADPEKVKRQMYLMVLIVLALNVLLFLAHACLSDRNSGPSPSDPATTPGPRTTEP